MRWPKAVLWDMDGTLVDTEPYWIEAEYALIEEHGGTWSDEHAMNLVGSDLIDSGRYLREHSGIDLEPAEIVEELLDRVVVRMGEQVPWRDGGARAPLGAPRDRHALRAGDHVLPPLRRPDARLAAAGHLPGGRHRRRRSRGKPHPEPYLTAARHLRLAPEDCLAIEDSNTGARSAEAAGATVLVVPNHVPVLPGERRVFRDSLAGLTPGDLPALLAGSDAPTEVRVSVKL